MAGFKAEIKDTIIFFMITSAIMNFHIWSIIIPYYYSYVKHTNMSITIKDIFSALFFAYVGSFVSTIIFPSVLYLFGLKNSLILGVLIYVLNNTMMHTFTNYWMIALNVGLIGFCFRYFTTATILYFSAKYPAVASKCYGIAYCGFILSSFVWSNLLSFYINPDNEQMRDHTNVNGFEEIFFEEKIAVRFKNILNIQSIYSLLTVFGSCLLFENPEKYKSNVGRLFGCGPGGRISVIEDIKNTTQHVNESVSYIMVKENEKAILDHSRRTNRSIEKSLFRDNESFVGEGVISKPQEIAHSNADAVYKEFATPKFWLIFSTSVFRISSMVYFLTNCKIFGYTIVGNDHLITTAYSTSSFLSIVATASTAFLNEKIGLVNCYRLSLIISVLNDVICISLIKDHPYLFLFLVFFSRIHTNFNFQLSNVSLFTCYDLDVALNVQKLFDLHTLLANIIMILVNQFLYVNGEFTYAFIFYFVVDGLALYVAHTQLKKVINQPN